MNLTITPVRRFMQWLPGRRPPGLEPWSFPLATPRIVRLSADHLARPEPLFLDTDVRSTIEHTIGQLPAESGGMLGGSRLDGVARTFHFDQAAATSAATYSPDTTSVNALLRERWNPAGVNLLGFVHSHPAGMARPSGGDLAYAERILAAIPDLDRLLLPIVQTVPDTGRFSLHPFAAERDGRRARIQPLDLVIAPVAGGVLGPFDGDGAYARVTDAYDLARMATTRIVAVGAGGAASYLEDLARAGVGEFVLIDPDVIDRPNLGTQQVYRRDLGRPKVDPIAERIVDVNLHARVATVRASLDDLDDQAMHRLVHRPLPNGRIGVPGITLLCGFTDDFWAQARVNRLALHLGVPMLAAGVYREGRGAEVVFTVPGLTPACARCALSRRYDAQLAQDPRRTVTSHGTPLYATTRLNALKELVTVMILLGTSTDHDHPAVVRQRAALQRIATRNLAQVRLDPDIATTLGLGVFDRVAAGPEGHRLVLDDCVWLNQEPDSAATGRPPCPDCGGTGDLRDSIGRFTDTRPTPLELGQYRRS